MLTIHWYDCDGHYEGSERVRSLEDAQKKYPMCDVRQVREDLWVFEAGCSGEVGRIRTRQRNK